MPHEPVEPGKFTTQDLTQQNSTPTHGFAIMSVVFAPLAGESVPHGDIDLKGVAWNDGVVALNQVCSPSTAGIRGRPPRWMRRTVHTHAPLAEMCAAHPGTHEVWVRAIDAWGRSQSLDGLTTWNPGAWDWHGVDHVCVAIPTSMIHR